jgi:tetratricopeptide (TPR) repeat protein
MRTIRGQVGLAVFIAVLAVSSVAAQDTKRIDDAFKKGLEALDDEEWARAIKYFQEALSLDPKESSRKLGRNIFGLFGTEYLPHARIGQAYLGLKDCAKALAEWEESERQGAVKKSEDGREILEDGQEECKEKGYLTLAEYRAGTQRAQGILKEAGETEQIVARMAGANPDVVAGDLKALFDRARADLGNARNRLGDVEQTRKAQAMTEAVAAAEGASRALESARASVTRAVANATPAPVAPPATVRPSPGIADAEALVESVNRAAQAVATTLSSSPVPITVPGDVAASRQRAQASLDEARARLAAARKTGADADLADARRLASEAQTLLTKVQGDVDRLRSAAVEGELKTLRASAVPAFAAADARVSEVQGVLSSHPPAADASQRANAQLKKAQASLAKARKDFDQALASKDVGAARSARAAISDVTRQLDIASGVAGTPVVTPAVPDVLRTAAQAFFDGRYDEVAKTLTDDAVQSMTTAQRVHAYTLRAASLFARYEYSNRRDESLRAAARQNVDASRRLDATFQPNPAAFAPKFIAFFSETVTAGR